MTKPKVQPFRNRSKVNAASTRKAPRRRIKEASGAAVATSDETIPETDPALLTAALPTPKGKLGIVVEMLRQPDGARIDQISEATGWQAHSIRGAMSGALKKQRGFAITSEPGPEGRVYRMAPGSQG